MCAALSAAADAWVLDLERSVYLALLNEEEREPELALDFAAAG